VDPVCEDLERVLDIDSDCKSIGVHVAYTVAWKPSEQLKLDEKVIDKEISSLLEEVGERYDLESLKENPVVRAYRSFFWRIGIDPTKTRPASEALLRRAIRGAFPRINPVVDAGNIASARTLVAIGIYDLDRAMPPLRIVMSSGGELFKPIGGKERVVPRGVPIMVDSRGVVMHLYPHRDSVETCVSDRTERVLIVAAGVSGVPRDLVISAVNEVVRILRKLGWQSCGKVLVK